MTCALHQFGDSNNTGSNGVLHWLIRVVGIHLLLGQHLWKPGIGFTTVEGDDREARRCKTSEIEE